MAAKLPSLALLALVGALFLSPTSVANATGECSALEMAVIRPEEIRTVSTDYTLENACGIIVMGKILGTNGASIDLQSEGLVILLGEIQAGSAAANALGLPISNQGGSVRIAGSDIFVGSGAVVAGGNGADGVPTLQLDDGGSPAVGGNGGEGGDVVLHAADSVTLLGTLVPGNGGRGGEAVALGTQPVAQGGQGGDAGLLAIVSSTGYALGQGLPGAGGNALSQASTTSSSESNDPIDDIMAIIAMVEDIVGDGPFGDDGENDTAYCTAESVIVLVNGFSPVPLENPVPGGTGENKSAEGGEGDDGTVGGGDGGNARADGCAGDPGENGDPGDDGDASGWGSAHGKDGDNGDPGFDGGSAEAQGGPGGGGLIYGGKGGDATANGGPGGPGGNGGAGGNGWGGLPCTNGGDGGDGGPGGNGGNGFAFGGDGGDAELSIGKGGDPGAGEGTPGSAGPGGAGGPGGSPGSPLEVRGVGCAGVPGRPGTPGQPGQFGDGGGGLGQSGSSGSKTPEQYVEEETGINAEELQAECTPSTGPLVTASSSSFLVDCEGTYEQAWEQYEATLAMADALITEAQECVAEFGTLVAPASASAASEASPVNLACAPIATAIQVLIASAQQQVNDAVALVVDCANKLLSSGSTDARSTESAECNSVARAVQECIAGDDPTCATALNCASEAEGGGDGPCAAVHDLVLLATKTVNDCVAGQDPSGTNVCGPLKACVQDAVGCTGAEEIVDGLCSGQQLNQQQRDANDCTRQVLELQQQLTETVLDLVTGLCGQGGSECIQTAGQLVDEIVDTVVGICGTGAAQCVAIVVGAVNVVVDLATGLVDVIVGLCDGGQTRAAGSNCVALVVGLVAIVQDVAGDAVDDVNDIKDGIQIEPPTLVEELLETIRDGVTT